MTQLGEHGCAHHALHDINNAWAACQSAEASSDAIARRIGMASYVDDATYSSINQSSEKIRLAIALERPNGIETVTHQDDRDRAWAYALSPTGTALSTKPLYQALRGRQENAHIEGGGSAHLLKYTM